jgi:hypothetical protein
MKNGRRRRLRSRWQNVDFLALGLANNVAHADIAQNQQQRGQTNPIVEHFYAHGRETNSTLRESNLHTDCVLAFFRDF